MSLPPPAPGAQRRIFPAEKPSFVILLVLVTIAFCWLLLPYFSGLLWAVILAILFRPLHDRLEDATGGRRGLAAAVSVLACICIVVIPGGLVVSSMAREAASLYDRISSNQLSPASVLDRLWQLLPDAVTRQLEYFGITGLGEIQSRITTFLGEASQTIATRVVSIGQDTLQLVIGLGIMLYVLFFLFRDGPELLRAVRRSSPLSPAYTNHFLARFTSTVKATVKGNVIIALIQGLIGSVAFWAVGLEAAVLWGSLMALLSLLPAVGAALVWAPAAAYLMLTGEVLRGVVLILIGTLVIGLVDNLLRPPLVGREIRLPDFVVLVSTVGGISLFGINGFVIGPLIAALFVAAWSLFAAERDAGRA